MGIKDLKKLFEYTKYLPKDIILKDLSGKKIAIDTSIFIYKYSYDGNNLVKLFFSKIKTLINNNITPIFIFDGKPNPKKTGENEKRREGEKKKKESYQQAIDKLNKYEVNVSQQSVNTQSITNLPIIIQTIKNETQIVPNTQSSQSVQINLEKDILLKNVIDKKRQIIDINPKRIDDLMDILELLDIPFHTVNNVDAEAVAVDLEKRGVVDYVISEDMDCLPYGCKNLITGFGKNMKLYVLNDILKELDITYDNFVKTCVNLGCDFCKRKGGYGPKKSFDKRSNPDEVDPEIFDIFYKGLSGCKISPEYGEFINDITKVTIQHIKKKLVDNLEDINDIITSN